MKPALRETMLPCDLGDVIILLDLLSGRYLMLSGRAAGAVRAFLAGQPSEAACAWMRARGWISDAAPVPSPYAPCRAQALASSIDALGPARASSLLMARAMLAQYRARIWVARLPLAISLARLRAGKPTDSPDIRADPSLPLAFRRTARWFSQGDQCLPRSLALATMLHARGQAATLVIGVAMPFAAHCWVQQGNMLLTEPLETVQRYTPILAV